jgi:hypothetical protein
MPAVKVHRKEETEKLEAVLPSLGKIFQPILQECSTAMKKLGRTNFPLIEAILQRLLLQNSNFKVEFLSVVFC